MTNLDRYREVLVCTAAIPLDKGRQAHVPLWAPVMVDGGVFLERVRWAGRAEVDAFEAVVTVLGTLRVATCRVACSQAVIGHYLIASRSAGVVA